MTKKEYDRLRYLEKRDEINTRNKEYNKKHREHLLQYSKNWYQENFERERNKRNQYLFDNKEELRPKRRKWRQNNKGKVNAYCAKYRASKLQQTPKWADLKAIEEFYKNCPEGYHVDHIIPLQGKNVRGLHVLENLQYLTKSENLRKKNKHA